MQPDYAIAKMLINQFDNQKHRKHPSGFALAISRIDVDDKTIYERRGL